MPLTNAATISLRCRPKVRDGVGATAASRAASSAIPIAPTSESRWPASASSASEPASMPPTTVATSIAALIASATHMPARVRRAA